MPSDTDWIDDDNSPCLPNTRHGIAGNLPAGTLEVPLTLAEVVGDKVNGGDDEERADAAMAARAAVRRGDCMGTPSLYG